VTLHQRPVSARGKGRCGLCGTRVADYARSPWFRLASKRLPVKSGGKYVRPGTVITHSRTDAAVVSVRSGTRGESSG